MNAGIKTCAVSVCSIKKVSSKNVPPRRAEHMMYTMSSNTREYCQCWELWIALPVYRQFTMQHHTTNSKSGLTIAWALMQAEPNLPCRSCHMCKLDPSHFSHWNMITAYKQCTCHHTRALPTSLRACQQNQNFWNKVEASTIKTHTVAGWISPSNTST